MNLSQQRRPLALSQRAQSRRHRPDYALVIISIILLVIGLIIVYAISPALSVQQNVGQGYFITKQLIAVGLGIISFIILAAIPYQTWRRFQKLLIVLATLAALAVRIFGQQVNGAYRWIRVGGISFQPVELIKFALLIWLASFLAQQIQNRKLADMKQTLKPLLIAFVLVGIVVAKLQSDLGSTGVIVAMMAVMCFIAGLPMKKIMLFGSIIIIGAVLAVSTSSYRRDRLLTYLHPQRDCQSTGYQACQALIAVGSGGLFGKGLTHSVQDYGYLPEAANDSIFATIAEKFGFIGVVGLVLLFMIFFTRLKNIMERAPDDFSRLLVAGILAWLSTQAIINIGAMIGLLSLTGITLPFISYGGTSILFVTAAVGLVFNISRYTTHTINVVNPSEGEEYDNFAYGRRGNGRPYYAHLSRRA